MVFSSKKARVYVLGLCVLISTASVMNAQQNFARRATITEQEAYVVGEDAVKFIVKYCISLGQGNFFADLKEMVKKGNQLKLASEQIKNLELTSSARASFIRGLATQLEKENVDDFVAKARFTPSQATIVKDVWHFVLGELRVLKNMNIKDWASHTNQRMAGYGFFFGNLIAALTKEFDLLDNQQT